MKVLQIIDSLRPGGAEKMAVNIANALVPHVESSFLCCTRQEGMLKDQLNSEVNYFFLEKKATLDLGKISQLLKFIKDNEIDIVQAHSTSFFLGGILKLLGAKIKLVWHDHYGESNYLEKRNIKILKIFSLLFEGIISVNTTLEIWASHNLRCKKVIEIKNFISEVTESFDSEKLSGSEDSFKIICIANLRPQKDHLNLLKAIELVVAKHSNVSLHLFGEDPETEYSKSVLASIEASYAKNEIFYYGPRREIQYFLKLADLGVLPSRSEGLPLVLLEYGMASLPIVVTDVGKCREVVGGKGEVVPANDPESMAAAIISYIEDEEKRSKDSAIFHERVQKEFSPDTSIKSLLKFFHSL